MSEPKTIFYVNRDALNSMRKAFDPEHIKVVPHEFFRVGARFDRMLVQVPDAYTLERYRNINEFWEHIETEAHCLPPNEHYQVI